MFYDFKADNVHLWSPSLDHLINCKVADFKISSHIGPGGLAGLDNAKKSTACFRGST